MAVTGSRADWGLLAPPLALLRDDPAFHVTLAVTGQHLAPDAKGSQTEIVADGFAISARVDLEQDGTTVEAVATAIGNAVTRFSALLESTMPDLLFVLGDRYEIFGAVQAALLTRTPVAHLCGGDVSEGAFDDAMRHSITKMSHIHFVTNADAARRVRQMGENPDHVHMVGSTGLDRIRLVEPMPRAAFFDSIGFSPQQKNAIVTFHPATLSGDSERQLGELLIALEELGPDFGLIFTGVNLDTGGSKLQAMIDAFALKHENAVSVPTLGSRGYVSALSYVDLMIGNSSSGLYEAPSFRIPTVNVGDRQKGRLRARSVIDCEPHAAAIRKAIKRALALDCADVVNPYGDGFASERIVSVLKSVGDLTLLRKKSFHMLEAHNG